MNAQARFGLSDIGHTSEPAIHSLSEGKIITTNRRFSE